MSQSPPTNPAASHTTRDYRLQVNAYDRTATLLVALLVIVGLTVTGLVIVFLANRTFPTIEPIPVVPVEATSPNANQGIADEPEPPGFEEAPELTEPQLQDTLEALTMAVTQKQVLLSDEQIDAQNEASKGQGLGDARMAGPGGDGVVERVPRWERWKIRFEPDSVGEFARWLDYYEIEIGVLGRDNQIHYAYDLSSSSPKTKANDKPQQESRGYTSAADGPMPELTMELARKAGIARLGSLVLLFYPFEVESVLWTMEREFSGGRDANEIRETVFTVEKARDGFEFEVIDQKYF